MKKLLFLDLETGGLDPNKHDILEVAFKVPVDGNISCFRVLPSPGNNVTTEAARINGYSPEKWHSALDLRTAMCVLWRMLDEKDYILSGHNVRFDYEFLVAAFDRVEMPPPVFDYHFIDTASIAAPLLLTGEIKSLSLNSLCEHFKTVHRPDHSAISDVLATVDLFNALMERFGFDFEGKGVPYVLQ